MHFASLNQKSQHLYSTTLQPLTLYTLTSVCIFSILFSIHSLTHWQGEFDQSRASLVGDHTFPNMLTSLHFTLLFLFSYKFIRNSFDLQIANANWGGPIFFFLNLLYLSTLEIKQKWRNVNKKTKRYTRKRKKKENDRCSLVEERKVLEFLSVRNIL